MTPSTSDSKTTRPRPRPSLRCFGRSIPRVGRYDAIICLFSSIAYLRTLEGVTDALRCFRNHLATGGVVVVEPWFTPDALEPGHRSVRTGEADGVHIERTSATEIEGRLSRIRFDYLVTDSTGRRRSSETHELGLFTVPEMLGAFAAAGLAARSVNPSLSDRGLYVATVAA